MKTMDTDFSYETESPWGMGSIFDDILSAGSNALQTAAKAGAGDLLLNAGTQIMQNPNVQATIQQNALQSAGEAIATQAQNALNLVKQYKTYFIVGGIGVAGLIAYLVLRKK